MRRVPVQDVFAAAVPERLIGADNETVGRALDAIARATVIRQYAGQPGLIAIENLIAAWLITVDPDEVDRFQPDHDCAACRAGNDQARAHLREHPDKPVALANLSYTEVWES